MYKKLFLKSTVKYKPYKNKRVHFDISPLLLYGLHKVLVKFLFRKKKTYFYNCELLSEYFRNKFHTCEQPLMQVKKTK